MNTKSVVLPNRSELPEEYLKNVSKEEADRELLMRNSDISIEDVQPVAFKMPYIKEAE